MNIKVEIHNRNLETRKNSIKGWNIQKQDKKDLIKFLYDLELGKVNKGKKISQTRQLKYLDILKIPLTFFNKQTSKLTKKDIENFETALTTNKIISFKGKPYSEATKSDFRRLLRIYLKWKRGDTIGNNLTDFFDTRTKRKTPDYLNEQEIEKLFKACRTTEDRFLIAVLFDSGARAEEFHNIRKEDIQLPTGNKTYVTLTLKEEYSKTAGRVISLYWKHSLEAVKDYLDLRTREGIKNDEQIFTKRYDNVRQFLNRLGKNVLGKNIHYHLFRHSSATYFASRMNRQQLCYRYGWKFSSDMPDVYISRSGMENKELDTKFSTTELEEVKNKLEKDKQEKSIEIEQLKSENQEVKNEFVNLKKDNLKHIKELKKFIQLSKDSYLQEFQEIIQKNTGKKFDKKLIEKELDKV